MSASFSPLAFCVKGEEKNHHQAYVGNTCCHGDHGALRDGETRFGGGGREEKGSGPPELEHTFRISSFQISQELQEYSII